jgi:NADH-quinone oxidoreductase E subunit
MDYVADFLEMPRIVVYEVASFYTMYNLSPVGQNHVQICTNLPCWLRGSDKVVNAIEKKLKIKMGETTEDNLFTLTEVECLGACVNAPIIQINDYYYEDLDETSADILLTEIANGGVPKVGSRIGRLSCEPINGLTTLVNSIKD